MEDGEAAGAGFDGQGFRAAASESLKVGAHIPSAVPIPVAVLLVRGPRRLSW